MIGKEYILDVPSDLCHIFGKMLTIITLYLNVSEWDTKSLKYYT